MTSLASPLVNNRFKVAFSKLPHVSFYAQTINLPGISLDKIPVGTPFSYMNEPGDKLVFGNLTMGFKLDENLDCYLEIFNWMQSLGFPENFDQYNRIGREGTFGDASVIVGNNNGMKGLAIKYVNVFPVSLSGIPLDATVQQATFIDSQVSFSFDYYQVSKAS